MDMRYAASVAALKVLGGGAHVAMDQDEIKFIMGSKLWLSQDRARVRRGVEAFAFGALDVLGLPRFPLPAEFVACVIATIIHPSNWTVACVVMSGAEWSENVVMNREDPLRADVLFSHVLRIAGGAEFEVDHVEAKVRSKYRKQELDPVEG